MTCAPAWKLTYSKRPPPPMKQMEDTTGYLRHTVNHNVQT